jgi:toxin ParE1/3/4
MKPAFFHPAAELEMIDAAAWYETQQTNLGKRFLTSVQDAINRLTLKPKLYSLVESDVRRCLTKTFPFGVLFRIKRDRIEIIAVMHLHREPNYWENRKQT